jgi:hypothetical protein
VQQRERRWASVFLHNQRQEVVMEYTAVRLLAGR